jgi:glycine/sarcosine N-methyltransferase
MNHEAIRSFYDELADEYDSMTQFDSRLIKEEPVYRQIVQHYGLKNIVDVGSGTGFHSILLAKLGCSVTSVDVSDKMLIKLKDNATKYSLTINTVQSDFGDLKNNLKSNFDAVFCMGNSLPHLLTIEEINSAIGNFYNVLSSNGVLFLQILNYERIILSKNHIQSIREINGKTYIRYYNFTDKVVEFNVIISDRSGENTNIKHKTIKMYPIIKSEIAESLLQYKFGKIEYYGSISLAEYNPSESSDLFIIASKI